MFCIYLEVPPTKVASKAHADRDIADRSTDTSQMVRSEVGAKWNKLSEQDPSDLKARDDLVREIV
jgi:hypothetical protein